MVGHFVLCCVVPGKTQHNTTSCKFIFADVFQQSCVLELREVHPGLIEVALLFTMVCVNVHTVLRLVLCDVAEEKSERKIITLNFFSFLFINLEFFSI